jgi:hypothetical protein
MEAVAAAAQTEREVGATAPVAPLIRDYNDFWGHYMHAHRHLWTRRFHIVAALIGWSTAILATALTRNLWWIPAGACAGFLLAWTSHLLFERNKPVAFNHPAWSMVSEMEMVFVSLFSNLDAELSRLEREPHRPATTQRFVGRFFLKAAMYIYLTLVLVFWYRGILSLHFPLF